jgi:hypothetical protein
MSKKKDKEKLIDKIIKENADVKSAYNTFTQLLRKPLPNK